MTIAAEWMLPPPSRPAGRKPRLVAMGGDGIGREVVAATLDVIDALALDIEILQPPHGADVPGGFTDETRRICDSADAILFGACEEASFPVLLYLRHERPTYANIRPAVSVFSAERSVDLVIVRELSEGMYLGFEGALAELGRRWPEMRDVLDRPLPSEGAFALRVVTPAGARRIGRYAAQLCAHRATLRGRPGKLTIVTKENVLGVTDGLFRSICEEEARAAGVASNRLYVDEAARRLVARPSEFDVIVTTNLFGDILSDVSSEAVGGMPVSPSVGLGEGFFYYEPVHGSGPDIAGKGIANPFGAMLSAAMALYQLGFSDASGRLIAAVQHVGRAGICTPDMGGNAKTREVVEAVRAALKENHA